MKIISILAAGLVPLLALASPAVAFEPIIALGGQAEVIHPAGGTMEVLAIKDQTGSPFSPESVANVILASPAKTDGYFSVMTLSSFAGENIGAAIVRPNQAEIWYVLEGTFQFQIGAKTVQGGPGTLVAVDAGQSHGFLSVTSGKLLVLFTAGTPTG